MIRKLILVGALACAGSAFAESKPTAAQAPTTATPNTKAAASEADLATCSTRMKERASCKKEICAMASELAAARHPEHQLPDQAKAHITQACEERIEKQATDDAARKEMCSRLADHGMLAEMLKASDACQAKATCQEKADCMKPMMQGMFEHGEAEAHDRMMGGHGGAPMGKPAGK